MFENIGITEFTGNSWASEPPMNAPLPRRRWPGLPWAEPVLSVAGLTKDFGSSGPAGPRFALAPGQATALIGANDPASPRFCAAWSGWSSRPRPGPAWREMTALRPARCGRSGPRSASSGSATTSSPARPYRTSSTARKPGYPAPACGCSRLRPGDREGGGHVLPRPRGPCRPRPGACRQPFRRPAAASPSPGC